jgi:hypothetical protein
MADLEMLARWLIASRKTPDADGTIALHVADVVALRSSGFAQLVRGR